MKKELQVFKTVTTKEVVEIELPEEPLFFSRYGCRTVVGVYPEKYDFPNTSGIIYHLYIGSDKMYHIKIWDTDIPKLQQEKGKDFVVHDFIESLTNPHFLDIISEETFIEYYNRFLDTVSLPKHINHAH